MNMLTWKKVSAVLMAVITCGTFLLTQPVGWNQPETEVQAAVTIAELEAKKQENNKKIQEYENKLAQFSENQKQAEAYQSALQEKINALQSNMQILDTELENIKKNIYYLDADIASLEKEISEQEIRIEKGLEEFKLRIRAMYINGNDSLISALAGATDFYDLLSKYELISCVAKHDDALVTNLKAELEAYNQNKETLEAQKAELEKAQTDKQSMQKEMQNSMSELRFSYADSQAEQERLALEKASANKTIEQLEADNKTVDSAEAEIQEQIRRAEEEAKRKATETTTAVTTKKAVSTTTTTTVQPKETTAVQKEEIGTAPETAPVILTAPVSTTTTTAKPVTTTTKTTTTTVPETIPPTEAPEPVNEPETVPDYDDTAFGWPCPGYYYISSGFGTRWGTTHKGIDIAQNAGADAVASRPGKVIKINTSCTHNYGKSSNCCGNGYGNYVLIDHEDGTYSTMYAHLQSVIVSVGDYVEKGQTVGYVGTTGWSTGYHLHFEIRKDGVAVNPSDYLNY
ncbi:MAG: hypothetical protein E7496_03210 [Ruminococcus sp.]|nr:hypothetical protein [Ruminococcus sp.]